MARVGPDNLYPRSDLTPGATNPDVTEATIYQTIGKRGWAAKVRPPLSKTAPQKIASMKQYGFTDSKAKYEYDHLIPIELGGALNDPRNLWPQHKMDATHPVGAEAKDSVENYLHWMVMTGRMTLAAAQEAIVSDWYAVYLHLLPGLVRP